MRPNAAISSLITLNILWFVTLLATITVILLTGCGMGPRLVPGPAQGAAIHGIVHGGQQPVSGANVYLLAAGTSGFGNGSISLLYSGSGADELGVYVTTAADGSFSITGDYSCSVGQQVYLYVRGGDPGGGTNSAIGLMAVLGACPGSGDFSTSIPYVEINEVSTVAAAYALAAFATDAIDISDDEALLSNTTAAAAQAGMANAFANAANLVDLPTGSALSVTPAGNGVVPQATINTLANILATCVNSNDQVDGTSLRPANRKAHPLSLPYSDNCIALGLAVSGGDLSVFTGHTYDTATAAIFIAHNPSANISALYLLTPPQVPFSPILTSQPTDFTLSLVFTGAGLNTASSTAIDSAGSVWIADRNNTLDALTSIGAPISGSPFTDPSLSSPSLVAVDPSNNIWLTNNGVYSTTKFTGSGTFALNASLGYSPAGLSIDPSGNAWIPNANSYDAGVLSRVSPSGTVTSELTGLNFPQNSVLDGSGHLWFDSLNTVGVTGYSLSFSSTAGPYTAAGMSSVQDLAIDSSGNIWGMESNGTLTAVDSSGNALTGPRTIRPARTPAAPSPSTAVATFGSSPAPSPLAESPSCKRSICPASPPQAPRSPLPPSPLRSCPAPSPRR